MVASMPYIQHSELRPWSLTGVVLITTSGVNTCWAVFGFDCLPQPVRATASTTIVPWPNSLYME